MTAPLWSDPDGAVLDATQRYRYRLWRTLPDGTGRILFVMLNPSIADAYRDDHTLTRCRYYATAAGFARLDVVNLYAYRATKPADLALADDPVGPRNDAHIAEAAAEADLIVVATGELKRPHGVAHRYRRVLSLLEAHGPAQPLRCLGMTEYGYPRHPSRLANSARLELLPR